MIDHTYQNFIYYMKRTSVLLTFILIYFSLTAQTFIDTTDDNRKYYHDIGLSYSYILYHGDGKMVNLHGAYYFNPNLGVRTGLSYTRGITDDCNWMIKIPALFSLRTGTIEDMEPGFDGDESLGEFLFMTLLCILPKRFEVNMGPSFGYMTPERKFSAEEKKKSDNYYIENKMMVALDANAKMTIPMRRVGIDFSLGVSYLLTKNIKYYSPDNLSNKTQRWIGNFTMGAHYRF